MQPEYALTLFLLKERHLKIVLISNIYWLIGWKPREPLKQINSRCPQGYRLSITVLRTCSFYLISSKIYDRPGHIQRIFSRHLTKVRPGHLNEVQEPKFKLSIYIITYTASNFTLFWKRIQTKFFFYLLILGF